MSGARKCHCGRPAKVYAMDPHPGGWGDYYCHVCKPSGWITEYLYAVEPGEG